MEVFNQIRAGIFEDTDKIDGFLQTRVTRANVWDKALALFRA